MVKPVGNVKTMNAAVTESDQKLSLNDQLRDKFQLKTEPFGAATSLFFQGAQRQHNLETLRHLVSYGDMVLVLTGASGSGKTTLIAELSRHIVDGVKIVSLNPTLIASPKKLTLELCKRLDLHQVEGEPASRTMERVLEFCAHNSEDGERLLLVVDDAHKINKESFKFLLDAFRGLGSDSGICLLVSGRQDILHSVTQEGFDPAACSWIHQIHLKPFSHEDAETYVRLRLIRAGAKVEPVLSEAQKQALYELGKGCPGRINRVAPAVLLDSFELAKTPKKSSKGTSLLLTGIAASLLVSFAVIGYQYGFFGSSSTSEALLDSTDLEGNKGSQPVRNLNVAGIEGGGENTQNQLLADARKDINLKIERAEREAARLASLDITENLRSDTTATGSAVMSEAPKAETEPVNATSVSSAPAIKSTVEVAGEAAYSPEGIILPMDAKSEPGHKEVTNASGQVSIEEKAEQSSESRDDVASLAVKTTLSNQEAKPSTSHSRYRDERWLAAQKKGSYTIQVLGSRNEKTAIKYVDSEASTNDLFYIKSTYKNKPWYVVVLGVYPNKAAAKAKVNELPASIKKQKPWVRSLNGL